MKLFCYGTLRDKDVLELVAGNATYFIDKNSAYLTDYTALRVEGEQYPVLVSCLGEIVEGDVVASSSFAFWKRLDYFESGYNKARLHVDYQEKKIECICYFEEEKKIITKEPWHLTKWQKNFKKEFLEKTEKYMKSFGKEEPPTW